MDRGWWTRVGVIVVATLGSLYLLIPTYYSFFVLPAEKRNNLEELNKALPGWAPSAKYRLNLGLDLQGGIHMVMRVDTKTALRKRTERRAAQLETYLNEKKLEVTSEARPENLEVALTAKDAASVDAIEKELAANALDFTIVGKEGQTITLALNENTATQFNEQAVDQAMLVIRRRVDKWGVAEADIRKQGTDGIQISLPGYQDPERAKELIGRTAQLEFRLVDDTDVSFGTLLTTQPPPADAQISLYTGDGFPQLESPSRDALLSYLKDKTPKDRDVLLECVRNDVPGATVECKAYRSYLVERGVPLTGDSLTGAIAQQGQYNAPEVNITFDAQGARDFGDLTEKNVGRRMAIVLDENVQSAPRISEKIPNGTARITMGRAAGKTMDEHFKETELLATVLRAGALPAPVSTGETRLVGALLGPELIKKGSLAALIGVLLVVIFMAIYYKVAGLVADVALLLNGLLILSCLALLNGTLTLPGIAGFVLTLGIAVDANVLINERIREELAAGKSARTAVDQGYDRAFWTIFDAHVTTLIAGFILFFTGTGPVRGFATALVVGLIASLFTSIVVTRVISTYLIHGRNAETVSV